MSFSTETMSYAQKEARSESPREQRVIVGLTERTQKIEAVVVHFVGQASELRSRLLGERSPPQLGEGPRAGPATPTPSSDIDELRQALGRVERCLGLLGEHLASLERL